MVDSDHLVDTEKLEILQKNLTLDVISLVPFVEFSKYLHDSLMHSSQYIELNDSRGLKNLSEENIEASMKTYRHTRTYGSRMRSHEDNLTDSLVKLNVTSDPLVRSCKKALICKRCNREGHTAVSCREGVIFNDDDVLFWDIVVSEVELPSN